MWPYHFITFHVALSLIYMAGPYGLRTRTTDLYIYIYSYIYRSVHQDRPPSCLREAPGTSLENNNFVEI